MTGVPYRIGEQKFFVGVMLIDEKLVGEIEPQLAERVVGARRLRNMNGVVAVGVTLRPIRSRMVGSCRISGTYSLAAIVSGMFQVGLIVIDLISAVMIGVGVAGLPSTILVVQTCRSF